MFIGGRAIAHTPDDTLQNAGQSEHVIGNVEIHILNAAASGMLAIKAGIFGGIGDIERVEINPFQRLGRGTFGRHEPLHQMIGEIAQRMAERRQFPIEHGQHFGLVGMQHHIVQSEIAMHNRIGIIIGNIARQPVDQLVHRVDALRFRHLILLCPAGNLAGKIIARLAEIAQPDRLVIGIVQFCQC